MSGGKKKNMNKEQESADFGVGYSQEGGATPFDSLTNEVGETPERSPPPQTKKELAHAEKLRKKREAQLAKEATDAELARQAIAAIAARNPAGEGSSSRVSRKRGPPPGFNPAAPLTGQAATTSKAASCRITGGAAGGAASSKKKKAAEPEAAPAAEPEQAPAALPDFYDFTGDPTSEEDAAAASADEDSDGIVWVKRLDGTGHEQVKKEPVPDRVVDSFDSSLAAGGAAGGGAAAGPERRATPPTPENPPHPEWTNTELFGAPTASGFHRLAVLERPAFVETLMVANPDMADALTLAPEPMEAQIRNYMLKILHADSDKGALGIMDGPFTRDDVNSNYKSMAKLCHPDKFRKTFERFDLKLQHAVMARLSKARENLLLQARGVQPGDTAMLGALFKAHKKAQTEKDLAEGVPRHELASEERVGRGLGGIAGGRAEAARRLELEEAVPASSEVEMRMAPAASAAGPIVEHIVEMPMVEDIEENGRRSVLARDGAAALAAFDAGSDIDEGSYDEALLGVVGGGGGDGGDGDDDGDGDDEDDEDGDDERDKQNSDEEEEEQGEDDEDGDDERDKQNSDEEEEEQGEDANNAPPAGGAAGAAAGVNLQPRRKKSKKRKTGFHNVGKHGYGKTTAQKKSEEHVFNLNWRGFKAAHHAERQGTAFGAMDLKAQNNLWAIWKEELELMMENLGLMVQLLADIDDKKSANYIKWAGIYERYDYRTDVHVMMMNWCGFGNQGLCSNHKWAKKFYDDKDCSKGRWHKIFHHKHPWFAIDDLTGLRE